MYGGGGEEGVVLSMGYANMWDGAWKHSIQHTYKLRLNQDALDIIHACIICMLDEMQMRMHVFKPFSHSYLTL